METKLAPISGNVNVIGKNNSKVKKIPPAKALKAKATKTPQATPGLLSKKEFAEALKKADLFHTNNGLPLSDNEFIKLIANNACIIENVEICASYIESPYRESDWLVVHMVTFTRREPLNGPNKTTTAFYIRDEFKTFRANSLDVLFEIVSNLRLLWFEDYAAETKVCAYETYLLQKISEKDGENFLFTRHGDLIE